MLPALIVALTLAGSGSAPSAQVSWDKARAKMKVLDYEAALPLLEAALEGPEVSPTNRARIGVDLAITYVNLGRTSAARRTFDLALADDAAVTLPKGVSPKIRELFAESQAARQKGMEAVAPAPVAAPVVEQKTVVPAKPTPAPRPAPAAVAEPVQATPVDERAEVAPRGHDFTWPLVAGLVAAAAAGGGLAASLTSRSAATELRGSVHDRARTDALLSKQQTASTLGAVGYGVGGVVALIGATLLAGELGWGWFSGPGSATVALAGPGVAMQVRF